MCIHRMSKKVMRENMNLNVRVSGELSEHVNKQTNEAGRYENTSEYVRDLIRRDKEKLELENFERLKLELQKSFAAEEESYVKLSARDVIKRNNVS